MFSCSTMMHIPTSQFLKLSKFKPIPDPRCKTKVATLSMGCFWGPDSLFGSIKGIMRTKVGYTGGSEPDLPTYKSIGDYIESIELYYDPSKITYLDLLQVFWNNHDSTDKSSYRQYISAIHFHDKEQEQQARDSMKKMEETKSNSIQTLLMPYKTFYDAENYHQKYILRKYKIFLESLCLNDDEIKNTYAACVLNGYLGGHISETEKVRILDIGLSDEQLRYLEACL
ncbi:unnamed protein product [Gordionus sp. m RMFG-2023]|uniref:peptide methionine sulfoxide reductase-like n=1 Tax=Gordionus sp. m RMFG-2023 TaxID=3053472 RepID=UPI0030DFEB5D